MNKKIISKSVNTSEKANSKKSISNSDIDLSFASWAEKDILNKVSEVKKMRDEFYKTFLNIKAEDRNFENTIKASEDFGDDISKIYGLISIIVNLHTDKKIRDLAQKVEVELGNVFIEIGVNHDLFLAVKSYTDNKVKQETEKLSELQKYIINETIKSYKRSGMLLDKSDRKKLETKKKKLNKLSSDYNAEYNAGFHKGIWFVKEELLGISESLIENLKQKNGKYFITMSRGDKAAVMDNCKIRETRKRVSEFSYANASQKNLKRLQETLKIRYEISQMLGYKTYTDFALETELINTSKKLSDFMLDLNESLTPGMKKDFSKIESQAKKENENNLTKENKIHNIQLWDTAYLASKYEEETLKIDDEKISEYLEYENVLETTWSIMKSTFGLSVKRVEEGVKVFDKEVRIYEWSDYKSGSVLGYSLIDLFPRDGKYGHACVTDCDMNLSKGKYNCAGLISNFQIMKKDGKYLLSHENVNTFLHEMGHLMHVMSDKSKYSSVSMDAVSRDFVEIPSQFLENLLSEDKFLKQYTKHYSTGKVLDAKSINLLKTKNNSFLSLKWHRASIQAETDIEIHGKNSVKYFNTNNKNSLEDLRNTFSKIFNKKNKDFKLKMFENQNFLGGFAHLMGGYQSKYYSYIASYAYMCDVWESFKDAGMNSRAGLKYRNEVLAIGAQMPEEAIIEKYLDRKVSLKAFKDRLASS